MTKRIQANISDEAWARLNSLHKEANLEFKNGKISFSNLLDEIITTEKIDLDALRTKHTDLRKSLRTLAAQADLDIDTVLKTCSDFKSKAMKRRPGTAQKKHLHV